MTETRKPSEGSSQLSKTSQRSYPWYLGGVSASIAAVLTHPLDVSKVRLQTSQTNSMIGLLVSSVKTQGLAQGAYPGLTASVMRQMTYSLVRFGAYDVLKAKIQAPGEAVLPIWKLAIAAAGAGALGGVAGNPADIILVRMIGDTVKPVEQRVQYRNAIDGLFKMLRTEGTASLARGLGPNIGRAMLMNASQLATYDSFKMALLRTDVFSEGMPLHFCASFCAGTVATTICSPFDVIKSRIMSSAGSESIWKTITSSYAKEGPMFMFRGWLPAWIRLSPNTILVFVVLEKLRTLTDVIRGEDNLEMA